MPRPDKWAFDQVKNCEDLEGVQVWDIPDSEFDYDDELPGSGLAGTGVNYAEEKFKRSTRPYPYDYANRIKKADGSPRSAGGSSSSS